MSWWFEYPVLGAVVVTLCIVTIPVCVVVLYHGYQRRNSSMSDAPTYREQLVQTSRRLQIAERIVTDQERMDSELRAHLTEVWEEWDSLAMECRDELRKVRERLARIIGNDPCADLPQEKEAP